MARHDARELALRVLFEHDLVGTPLDEVLDRALRNAVEADGLYAQQLVNGAAADQLQLDQWINDAAHEWRVERMPAIDRNILRLSCYEMAHEHEVPLSVIIDEALELAQSYSAEDAKRFINGVLGAIAERVRPEGDTDRPS